ncbi:MAG: hypothetical protein ACXW5U_13585 [Thermoanaerobaculia bacterium]
MWHDDHARPVGYPAAAVIISHPVAMWRDTVRPNSSRWNCHWKGGEKKVDYMKPTYYEEAVDVNATTPGFVAVVAIIVIVAEVIANVASPASPA